MAIDITISEERANIFSDLREIERICLSDSNESEHAFTLLFEYWQEASLDLWNLGYWNDYFRCGNIILRVANSLNKVANIAQLLSELGYVCMEWENFDIAQTYFYESLHKYELIKDTRGQSRLLRYLGVLFYRKKDLTTALEYYRMAFDIVAANRTKVSHDSQWAFQEAELHNVIGEVYLELKEFSVSYRELNLSLDKYQVLGDQYLYFQADPLLNLGRWHFLQGDYAQAKHYYQDCIQLCLEITRPDTMANALLHMAELAEAEDNEEEALKLISESERVAGTEVTSVRDRAARFRERLNAKRHCA